MPTNTDYERRFMDLFAMMPDVYKSNTNRALFNNLFNRFLTKREVKKVAGYIGDPNPNAIVRRQIEEPTIHRQGFQLQPIMNAMIGSVRHMSSWKDIENELQRLGIDIERMKEWANVQVFNWVPPVDIDKLINWQNYYWVDEDSPTPEYITVKSRCATANAKVAFWEKIIDTYGSTIEITGISPYIKESDFPTFDIVEINEEDKRVLAVGDVSEFLKAGDNLHIEKTVENNGMFKISSIEFNEKNNETTIHIEDGELTDENPEKGIIRARFFDKIEVKGNYKTLFNEGFIFFIGNSENKDLSNNLWYTVASTYDEKTDVTTIQISDLITDNRVSGEISFNEILAIYNSEKVCECGEKAPWDLFQWDDNPDEPTLGGRERGPDEDERCDGDHESWLSEISKDSDPPSPIESTDPSIWPLQWYSDPEKGGTDTLFARKPDDTTYEVVIKQFSFVLENTTGKNYWDEIKSCEGDKTFFVGSSEQWVSSNKWVHRTNVTSFENARRANMPIIEYQWDIQLNEWNYTRYRWKYRTNATTKWQETESQPNLFELVSLELWEVGVNENIIVLDERYGDLTDVFTPGSKFLADETTEDYEVKSSYYKRESENHGFRTSIVIKSLVSDTMLEPGNLTTGAKSRTALHPIKTSQGHFWDGYGTHWLFLGADDPVPSNRVTDNFLAIPPKESESVLDESGDFQYVVTHYSQTMNFLVDDYDDDIMFVVADVPGSTRSLRRRALVGQNDVRVYLNGVRQFGNFDELEETENGVDYVAGIRFINTRLTISDVLKIEVGESSFEEIGFYSVPVRTQESNFEYQSQGDVYISLVSHRKVEQNKSTSNQYPLFDLFNMDGSNANIANHIFGYRTSSEYPVNKNVGLRVVYDPETKVYDYEQHLIDEDNGAMLAYRDFSNLSSPFWFKPSTSELFFWVNGSWTKKTQMGDFYTHAHIGDNEPGYEFRIIDGFYWYDTANNELKVRNAKEGVWEVEENVTVSENDSTLQTIWKGGINNEEYIPEKVDWDRRTKEEYEEDKELFIDATAKKLRDEDPNLSTEDSVVQSTQIWYARESNVHSSGRWNSDTNEWENLPGTWRGDWEVPDPMYYNHMHENRKVLNSAELRVHFNSIISSQPRIPGYIGEIENMFHLIPTNTVNYALGGTIHEYNDGFDTFLSSTFVNNVTPISLLEFAGNQYGVLLVNSIIEIYRENIIDYLTSDTPQSRNDIVDFVVDSVVENHWGSNYYNFIYGDSSTYDDETNKGMRNWIATLPYIRTMHAIPPVKLIDDKLGITEIKHHDGHYKEYRLSPAEAENITTALLKREDTRNEDSDDTWGRRSLRLPPNNISEFAQFFATTIRDRNGVYWYWKPSISVQILYRLNIVAASNKIPTGDFADGSLWFDTTLSKECLRIRRTNEEGLAVWDVVEGLSKGDGRLHNGTDEDDLRTATISAWKEINIAELLIDSIVEVERKLYDNAPDEKTPLTYFPDEVRKRDPAVFDRYMEDSFLDYVSSIEVSLPYSNVDYRADDPWTWNYMYSIPGGGHDITFSTTDNFKGMFRISGDHASKFDPCFNNNLCPSQVDFYVKNSKVNDGKWKTLLSTGTEPSAEYDAFRKETSIYVEGDVAPSIEGFIYQGILPGSFSTGAESGANWKTYYSQLYGTPYPHLEPWVLQGYESKPEWWDEEYANNDTLKWGSRRWKYKHGFEIIDMNKVEGMDRVEVRGNFLDIFNPGKEIFIDKSIENNGSYSISEIFKVISVDNQLGKIHVAGDREEYFLSGNLLSLFESNGKYIGSYEIRSSFYIGPDQDPMIDRTTAVQLKVDGLSAKVKTGSLMGGMYYPERNMTEIEIVNTSKPISIEKSNLGRITFAYGMWENIRVGRIPPGREYPNGIVSVTGIPSEDRKKGKFIDDLETWNYFSVNIDNNSISDNGGATEYFSDDLIPPYFDMAPSSLFDSPVRSVFSDYGKEIISPAADFTFGDGGPIEWDWRSSVYYNYDKLKACYRLDPVRYVTGTFGVEFYEVGGLQIDKITNNTFAHQRTYFHGDILNDKPLSFNGTNQWYVNFNRYLSFDNNYSDFSTLWKDWKAPMTYQFATFVDTPSFQMGHRITPLTKFDYYIDTKVSRGLEDFWMDSFKLIVARIPPDIARYDTQNEWEVEVNSHVAISREVDHYDVQNYQFHVDTESNVCTLYTWRIQEVDTFNNLFEIAGDQTEYFRNGTDFDVTKSFGNDGKYIVYKAIYNQQTDSTILEVNESVKFVTKGGFITINGYRDLPWATGQIVHISTTETLPSYVTMRDRNPEKPKENETTCPVEDKKPSSTSIQITSRLEPRAPNGLPQNFVIRIPVDPDDLSKGFVPNQFKLARTMNDAQSGFAYDFTSEGKGNHFVGKIHSTFKALGGRRTNTIWIHYAIDKSRILRKKLPGRIRGMQNLVNFMDGYDARLNDIGWRVNDENSFNDELTGRPVDWQLEVEKFIDYAYGLRSNRNKVKDKYQITVDPAADEFTFVDKNPAFRTGDKIVFYSSNGVYPDPIYRYVDYYYIYIDGKKFSIAATKRDAERGKVVEILSSDGLRELWIAKPKDRTEEFPKAGINPFRNAIWFRPPRGIVSNVVTGPTQDIRTVQTIVDQYGRKIDSGDVRVFREDKRTQISIRDNIPNTVEPPVYYFYPSDNDYIHISGIHLFIDAYEHCLVFNNYTTTGDLLYDPFLGLNTTKFEMLFNRKPEFNQRPNMSGYYYYDKHNINSDFYENLEQGVESIRYAYDTFEVFESNKIAAEVRKSLGYQGVTNYLNKININEKSQFLFWRGFIQQKGTPNSISAFLKSRRFIDAKVDEFWAFKVSEFGDDSDKEYIEMYVNTDDSKSNDWRFEFENIEDSELVKTDKYVI